MKRWIAATLAVMGSTSKAHAVDVGPRVNAEIREDFVLIGAEVRFVAFRSVPSVRGDIRLAVDYYPRKRGASLVGISGDLVLAFLPGRFAEPYVALGPTVTLVMLRTNDFERTDSYVGLNMSAGIKLFASSRVAPFAEVRVTSLVGEDAFVLLHVGGGLLIAF